MFIRKSKVVEIEKGDPTRVLWPLIRPLLLGHLRTRSVGDAVADTFYGTHIEYIHEIGGFSPKVPSKKQVKANLC